MITLESVFIDTGAWVALADKDDDHHAEAASMLPSILKDFRNALTSNLVVAESYVLILYGLGHDASREFLDRLTASPRIRIIY